MLKTGQNHFALTLMQEWGVVRKPGALYQAFKAERLTDGGLECTRVGVFRVTKQVQEDIFLQREGVVYREFTPLGVIATEKGRQLCIQVFGFLTALKSLEDSGVVRNEA